MTSIYIMAEQVMRRYRATVNSDVSVSMEELKLMVRQAANSMLNIARKESFQEGYGLPTMMGVATYLARPIQHRQLTLPFIPIQMGWDMGVWEVSDSETGEQIMPLPAAVTSVMGGEKIEAMGIKGYRLRGDALYFTNNVTASAVDIQMVVFPEYADDDPFPLPADMEFELIGRVIQMLYSTTPPKDLAKDSVDIAAGPNRQQVQE